GYPVDCNARTPPAQGRQPGRVSPLTSHLLKRPEAGARGSAAFVKEVPLMSQSDPPLRQELETYHRHRADLLRTAAGKFAVIRGEHLVGVYDSRAGADEAAASLGTGPVLVQEIAGFEKVRRVYRPRC